MHTTTDEGDLFFFVLLLGHMSCCNALDFFCVCVCVWMDACLHVVYLLLSRICQPRDREEEGGMRAEFPIPGGLDAPSILAFCQRHTHTSLPPRMIFIFPHPRGVCGCTRTELMMTTHKANERKRKRKRKSESATKSTQSRECRNG